MHSASPIHSFRHDDFDKLPVSYGFFGRRGGVSTGLYDSLNCGFGSDDNPEFVSQNRAACASLIGISADNIASVYQIHSADIVTITDKDQLSEERKKADVVEEAPQIWATEQGYQAMAEKIKHISKR